MEEKRTVRRWTPDRRLWLAGVVLAVVCFCVGFGWQYGFRLMDPVFVTGTQAERICGYDKTLDSYDGYEGNESFVMVDFEYITDRKDERVVSELLFPELDDAVLSEQQESREDCGRYVVHRLTGRIQLKEKAESRQWQQITEADAIYSDGTSERITVGPIVLLPDEEEDAPLRCTSVSVRSDGVSADELQVGSAGRLYVRAVAGTPEEYKNFAVTINGIPMDELAESGAGSGRQGIPVETGDTLLIESRWLGEEPYISLREKNSPVWVLELEGEQSGVFGCQTRYQEASELRFLDLWRFLREKEAF